MYRPRLSSPANGLPHEEIFEDKLALPRCQRTTANTADYLAGICLRPGFRFDDLVERATTRAGERIEPATHEYPIRISDQGKRTMSVMRLSHRLQLSLGAPKGPWIPVC